MKRCLLALALVVLALTLIAAAATHILVLENGDTGIIQCPNGAPTLVENSAHQVSVLCADVLTATATETATPTTTNTETPTSTDTPTHTPSATATGTSTPTATNTPTASRTRTPTQTRTATRTATATRTPTASRTMTATRTPTSTPALLASYLPIVIGDSVQDEYRYNDARGFPYQLFTLNWVEILERFMGIDLGIPGTWDYPDPRRSGYERNLARSGADTDTAIAYQLPIALAQLSSSAGTHVLIQIGINDLNEGGLGYSIYNGTLTGSALANALNHIADNISFLARQTNAVAPGRVMVASVQDYVTGMLMPETVTLMPDAVGRQRLSDAIAYINARVAVQAQIDGVVYWDYNAALAAELSTRLVNGNIMVGGQAIVLLARGNEPHSAWLDESPYAHAGTVLSGLIGNLYIRATNEKFGTAFVPLSDAEILAAAGIQ